MTRPGRPEPTDRLGRSRWPRHLGLAGLVAVAGSAAWWGIVLSRRPAPEADRAAPALDRLTAQVEANARAMKRLLDERMLALLAGQHPEIAALVDADGSRPQVQLLRSAEGNRPAAHGVVVWDENHRRGVLRVAHLPAATPEWPWQLVGRAAATGPAALVVTFRSELHTFALPAGVHFRRFDVRRVVRGDPHSPQTEALLVPVSPDPAG